MSPGRERRYKPGCQSTVSLSAAGPDSGAIRCRGFHQRQAMKPVRGGGRLGRGTGKHPLILPPVNRRRSFFRSPDLLCWRPPYAALAGTIGGSPSSFWVQGGRSGHHRSVFLLHRHGRLLALNRISREKRMSIQRISAPRREGYSPSARLRLDRRRPHIGFRRLS